MKKLIFVIGLLAVIGAAIYGVLYLDRISVDVPFQVQPMEPPKIGDSVIDTSEQWLHFIPDGNERPYAYPATELSIRFDFVDNSKQNIPSAISIDELDEYKFACVKQVLRENRIESAYYKSGNTLKLMVFVTDEAMYEKLLADLKYYRLHFSVQ